MVAVRSEGLTEDDLTEVLKLQFRMIAETLAEIAQIRGKKTTVQLSCETKGCGVKAVLSAEVTP